MLTSALLLNWSRQFYYRPKGVIVNLSLVTMSIDHKLSRNSSSTSKKWGLQVRKMCIKRKINCNQT